LREPPPRAGEVPWLRVADDLQLDTGRCKAGDPGVEEALEAFSLGQPVEASDDDRASRRVGSDGTMLSVDLGIRIGKGEPQATYRDSRMTLASRLMHDNEWPPLIKA